MSSTTSAAKQPVGRAAEQPPDRPHGARSSAVPGGAHRRAQRADPTGQSDQRRVARPDVAYRISVCAMSSSGYQWVGAARTARQQRQRVERGEPARREAARSRPTGATGRKAAVTAEAYQLGDLTVTPARRVRATHDGPDRRVPRPPGRLRRAGSTARDYTTQCSAPRSATVLTAACGHGRAFRSRSIPGRTGD